MLEEFMYYLKKENLSENTLKSYLQSIKSYFIWFEQSKGVPFTRLHRENILEFISFLKTVKQNKAKTINTKINALVKFNEFLIDTKIQKEMILKKKDYIPVQTQYASLANFGQREIEQFRQVVLDSGSKRNYAIVTLLAYAGLRISEALSIKMGSFNLISRELIVKGKNDKTRTVFINDKVKTALQSWLRERTAKGIESDYLFVSNRCQKVNRTTMNKVFLKFNRETGTEITPHDLRHFFCSHALNSGMSVHEVANQAGHSNIHTTLLYTNPSKSEILDKMNKL